MDKKYRNILDGKIEADSLAKLEALDNARLHAFVADAVVLCRPNTVKVCNDDPADIAYIRQAAIDNGEETPLAIEGHTIHFDGHQDQGRDKQATKYLVPRGVSLGRSLNAVDRDEGIVEIHEILAGAMEGKEMYVRFFCLGPTNSSFSISCVQITDSAYVSHSEDMLYRSGYQQFKHLGRSGGFFRFLHSAGRLVNNVSADVDKRRIYIDIRDETVYSANTQYAGNTVGFKKLALRLAIRKADREGWLAEHMLIMGVHGPGGRVTYFTGAYPSGCGKTSTAMLPGETIVGDDLAYFRAIDGEVRAVNVESGIFGIIRDVGPQGDPVIYDVLTKPGEVIFSNVLVKDRRPYWVGMGRELPSDGVNYRGQWKTGQKDKDGNEIGSSHWNARYTIRLSDLENLDPRADDPEGVPVGGIVYGGRDSDTAVPVKQSFDWTHGIITLGASLESETTAATLGAAGVRAFNLMSNLDFLAIPLGKYIRNNLDFAEKVARPPLVFATNYWLKDKDDIYLNGMLDKGIWMKWMELRVHGDGEAATAPTGLIPTYEILARLFRKHMGKDYAQEQYVEQFTIRIPENLAKVDRIEKIYRDVADTPQAVFDTLKAQRQRLEEFQTIKGNYVSPLDLEL
ncbi:MAG: phosphoenolpyruvate carboxykinase (GTP) [Phycisphaerae bacterium]|jgi:phosphoenolpyruvate carboxykinase (GTP)|nr:phosphoenolpyruvate carboxykinase (GTP) [Phycisphaerae bacterium]